MPVIDLGSVVGPQGPQGATGATGAQGIQGNPGPNQVTDQTSTNLIGVLQGVGSRVAVKPVDSTPTANSANLVSSGGVKMSLDAKANQTQLATVESGSTASRNYAVGEYFCLNGLLYRATSGISSGGTITPGTNCEATTVGSQLFNAMPIGMHLIDFTGVFPTTATAQTIGTGIPNNAWAICLGIAGLHRNNAHYSITGWDQGPIMNGSNLRFTPNSDSVTNYGGNTYHAYILYHD